MKQTIGLGTTANDGTGTNLRAAGDMINDNFDELYDGFHPGYRDGIWIPAYRGSVGQGSDADAGKIRLFPFMLPRRAVISELGAFVHQTASGSCQFALYAGNAATGRPTGAALGSTGNIAIAAANASSSAAMGANVTVEALVLMFFASNCSVGNVNWMSASGGALEISWMLGSTDITKLATSGFGAGMSLSVNSVTFGTWPSLTSASFTEERENRAPVPFLKIFDATP